MWKKGSMTLFYSLILSMMLALISALLFTAKISAARAHTAMAVDQAMFSAMAKYDKELLEEYHLFFIDGGYGGSTLQTGKILDELESELSYLLMPSKEKTLFGAIDFLDISLEDSGITGYTLATDQNGNVFRSQVVQYMKETMVSQNISSLAENWHEGTSLAEESEGMHEKLETSTERFSPEVLEYETESAGNETVSPEDVKRANEAKDILKSVDKVKKGSILNWVLRAPEEVSDWETEKKMLVSNRKCQTGMGIVALEDRKSAISDTYLFQEYMMRNLNCYGNELHKGGPSYGLEYIIGGKPSDIENLENVVTKLLAAREAINTVHLYTDGQKKAVAESIAMTIAAVFLIPEFQGAIEATVILAWAYVESLVDVRALLSGKAVPMIKNSASWQVDFENILAALTNPDSFVKSSGTAYYKDYLKYLLLMVSDEKETMRCMDVIELTLRELPGKENFSMDCAVDSLEVMFSVTAENQKELEIVERRSYGTM